MEILELQYFRSFQNCSHSADVLQNIKKQLRQNCDRIAMELLQNCHGIALELL